MQAMREGVEGALGFAPGQPGARGQSSFGIAAAREKKFEENIQDLQWQILYGDTSKDLQVAKLQDLLLAQQRQHEHDLQQLAMLQAERARARENKVEQWLLQDAFTTVF
jgi:hypothetical protein